MKINEFKEKYKIIQKAKVKERIMAFKEIREILSEYREFLYQHGAYSKQKEYGKYKEVIEDYEKQLEKYKKQLEILRSFRSNPCNMLESYFVNILVYYPDIIEWGLKYIDKNYLLGKSNFTGDILFLDLNDIRLNMEIKQSKNKK